MKEYISKDYLYSILLPRLADSRGAEHYAYDCIRKEIDYAPDTEIVHFGQGHWYPADDGDGDVCSACGEDFCNIYLETYRFKHCPNCGAIMSWE